jgi:general stress protein YciG
MVQKKMSQPKKQDLKHSSKEVSPEATAKTDKKGAASTDKAFNSNVAKKGAKASGSKTR